MARKSECAKACLEERRDGQRERERQAAAREDQAKMNKNPDALANEKVGSYVENGGC